MTAIYYFIFNKPPVRCYDLMKQAGFDGVSLMWDKAYGGEDFRETPKLAQKANLLLDSIHAPFEGMSFFWKSGSLIGEAATDTLLQCIDDCAEFKIPTMVMHAVAHASFGEAPSLTEIGLRRFANLIERAERKNVKIALENMRNTGQLLQTGELLERFNSPNLGFCFDSGHHNARLSAAPECDLLSRFGHRLFAVHLHDNKGKDDEHLLPFDGTIDWTATMKAIKDTGYKGATSLEVCNDGYENLTPEEFLKIAFERAKKLEALR